MKTDDIRIIPKWRKSKDDVWNEVFADLDAAPTVVKPVRFSLWRCAAAAVAAIVIVSGAAAYFYTTVETAARGTHTAVTLPDGSSVRLNAESELAYRPYRWFSSRDVRLKGEACFEVTPGSTFTVRSGANTVSVLGTGFNIYARADRYSVTCLTGKVEVASGDSNVLLTPNMQVNVRNGKLELNENADAAQSTGWMQNRFTFIGVPLADVVQEIERQYNIRIIAPAAMDFLYTGNFSKTENPEDALRIIGKPFGITFSIAP